jgi:hypothetical protein
MVDYLDALREHATVVPAVGPNCQSASHAHG